MLNSHKAASLLGGFLLFAAKFFSLMMSYVANASFFKTGFVILIVITLQIGQKQENIRNFLQKIVLIIFLLVMSEVQQ